MDCDDRPSQLNGHSAFWNVSFDGGGVGVPVMMDDGEKSESGQFKTHWQGP